MRIDYSPRASGRTTRMIEWLAADESRVLITFSHDEENRLKRMHPKLAHRIVDWESYRRSHSNGLRIEEVAIDNADLILRVFVEEPILQNMTRHPIASISIADDGV